MFLMAYPPDGWSSQDGRVLFDAERQAERFASNARLAFSLTNRNQISAACLAE